MLDEERLGGPDDVQRVPLALLGAVTPRGDAVPAEHTADGLRVGGLDGGDVESQLKPGPAPRHPHHAVPETLGGQLLPVDGAGERDSGVRVQMIDMSGVHQSMHGGVDGGRSTSLSVQAVVEGGDHLVLALDPRIHVGQRPHPVQPQHGQPTLGERPQVPSGPLDPHQLDIPTGDGVGVDALRGRVPAGVVGVTGIRTKPIGSREQSICFGVRSHELPVLFERGGAHYLQRRGERRDQPRTARTREQTTTRRTLRRPTPPAAPRPARRRSAPASRWSDTPRSDQGRAPAPPAAPSATAAHRCCTRP